VKWNLFTMLRPCLTEGPSLSLSGLHASPSIHVKPTHVAESTFSAEFQALLATRDTFPRTEKRSTMIVLVEIVQWYVSKDSINGAQATVDIEKLRIGLDSERYYVWSC
jgi:hypothetical protein